MLKNKFHFGYIFSHPKFWSNFCERINAFGQKAFRFGFYYLADTIVELNVFLKKKKANILPFLPVAGRKGASAQSSEGGEGRGDGRGGKTVGAQEAAGSGGGEEPRTGASKGQEEVRFGHQGEDGLRYRAEEEEGGRSRDGTRDNVLLAARANEMLWRPMGEKKTQRESNELPLQKWGISPKSLHQKKLIVYSGCDKVDGRYSHWNPCRTFNHVFFKLCSLWNGSPEIM